MDSLTYENVVDALVRRVPEFSESGEKWYRDLPHDAFGTFTIYLCRVLREDNQQRLAARAFELMNEMAESTDDQVVNLLEVSVFEIVADGDCLARVAAHLSEVARARLDRVLQG